MSANPQKKAKAKKPKKTSSQKARATTAPLTAKDKDSLGESWTDRTDSLKILVECAALLGISDTLDPESRGPSPDKLASRAVDLVNACEFYLKWEILQKQNRIEAQIHKLLELREFPSNLPFETGADLIFMLEDNRGVRLERNIKTLLEKDFEANPRFPRYAREYRRIDICLPGEKPLAPDLKTFIDEEFAWYRAKGFTPEDLRHLSALRGNKPAVTE